MRGITAYAGDFYFGTTPVTTDQQQEGTDSTGQAATSPYPTGVTMSGSLAGNPPASPQSKINAVNLLPGLNGVNPLWFIPIGLGLLVLLKIVREAPHKSEDFKTVKVDAYFVIMVTLAACLGIPLVKAIANKYPIQPITDYLNNA